MFPFTKNSTCLAFFLTILYFEFYKKIYDMYSFYKFVMIFYIDNTIINHYNEQKIGLFDIFGIVFD
jgi:hypothetical protein